jgi:hypothetical protein
MLKNYRDKSLSLYSTSEQRHSRAGERRASKLLSAILGLGASLWVTAGQAAFQLVEDFNSLALGNVDGQSSWIDNGNSGQVVADPEGGTNQVLVVNTESGVLYRPLTVAQGTSRMLFLRLRFEEHGVYSFGMTPLLAPDEYGDFSPELGMAAATNADPSNEFRVANGSTVNIYDVLETLLPETWYNVWILVDAATDTYQVWLNSTPGSGATSGDQLDNDAAETVFGFRLATSTDLLNFFIKTGGGASPVAGQFYLDDIYLEDTDTLNLNSPGDSNGDGLSDADAVALGLDPTDPDGDTDNDGQTDVIEIGGDVNNPLDSDVDGVIDALEPGATATDPAVASGLPLPNGATVTITTAAGEMLSQVSAAAVTNAPADVEFPFGSISYTSTSPVGGNLTVQMAFSTDLPADLMLYKQDGTGALSELPAAVWTLVNPSRIDMTLTDGDAVTDLDGAANGFIEDPVAPATLTSAPSSGGGGGGCTVDKRGAGDAGLSLLLMAWLGYGICRRGRLPVPKRIQG